MDGSLNHYIIPGAIPALAAIRSDLNRFRHDVIVRWVSRRKTAHKMAQTHSHPAIRHAMTTGRPKSMRKNAELSSVRVVDTSNSDCKCRLQEGTVGIVRIWERQSCPRCSSTDFYCIAAVQASLLSPSDRHRIGVPTGATVGLFGVNFNRSSGVGTAVSAQYLIAHPQPR